MDQSDCAQCALSLVNLWSTHSYSRSVLLLCLAEVKCLWETCSTTTVRRDCFPVFCAQECTFIPDYCSNIKLSSGQAVIFGPLSFNIFNFLFPDIFRQSAIIQVIQLKLG